MGLKKLLVLVALIAVLLTLGISVFAQGAVTATTEVQLNVRAAPATTATRLGALQPFTTVNVEARNEAGSWLLVSNSDLGIRGWVSANFLYVASISSLPVSTETFGNSQPTVTGNTGTTPTTQTVAVPAGSAICTTTSALNVRSTPSTSGRILVTLPNNTTLNIVGRNTASSWLLVRSQDGNTQGWVFARLVNIQGDVNSAPLTASAEVYHNSGAATTSTTNTTTTTNNTTATNVSLVPAGRTIWTAYSGADNMTGTCSSAPLVTCTHPAAVTLNSNGSVTWRGQEPKDYTLRSLGNNSFSFSGRNFQNTANISLSLTFTSPTSWNLTMRQVFDAEPSCTHTFYYTASPR